MEGAANGAADAVMATSGGTVDAEAAARQSQKECRVYVGNLSYEVKGDSLKDFMRDGA
jgi:RNA recognition motif-containing protein